MAIGAARCLEAGMGRVQGIAELAGTRNDEAFVWSPTTGRETLRQHEVEAIFCGLQVLCVAIHEVCLHG